MRLEVRRRPIRCGQRHRLLAYLVSGCDGISSRQRAVRSLPNRFGCGMTAGYQRNAGDGDEHNQQRIFDEILPLLIECKLEYKSHCLAILERIPEDWQDIYG